MNNYEVGMKGEDMVAEYLEKEGYHIIARNFRSDKGEIDVIFEDSKNLVFGEVKTRRSDEYGRPCEAVNREKKNRIIRVAKFYVFRNVLFDKDVRFDVFEVFYDKKKINHIKDAYYEDEPVLYYEK